MILPTSPSLYSHHYVGGNQIRYQYPHLLVCYHTFEIQIWRLFLHVYLTVLPSYCYCKPNTLFIFSSTPSTITHPLLRIVLLPTSLSPYSHPTVVAIWIPSWSSHLLPPLLHILTSDMMLLPKSPLLYSHSSHFRKLCQVRSLRSLISVVFFTQQASYFSTPFCNDFQTYKTGVNILGCAI